MSITRISVAELRAEMRDFTPEENARLDALSDEEIERRALADPDAQPATPEMMRRGDAARRNRVFSERMKAGLLGVSLSKAEPDLPVWEVTDRRGHKVYLQAADVRRVALPRDPSLRIVAIEAVVPTFAASTDASGDADETSSLSPEKQTT